MSYYKLKIQELHFGRVKIRIESLANMDEVIDLLIRDYENDTSNEISNETHQSENRKIKAQELDKKWPYFGIIWPSSKALASEVAKMENCHVDFFKNKKVLEIGCGLAMPSIVSSVLGAKVLATDFHADVPFFLERNLALNNLNINESSKFDYTTIDWSKCSDTGDKFDIILCSDVLYEKHQPEIIAKAILQNLTENGIVLVTDPGRQYLQDFVNKMSEIGFAHKMKIESVQDHGQSVDVFVLTFQKKS